MGFQALLEFFKQPVFTDEVQHPGAASNVAWDGPSALLVTLVAQRQAVQQARSLPLCATQAITNGLQFFGGHRRFFFHDVQRCAFMT